MMCLLNLQFIEVKEITWHPSSWSQSDLVSDHKDELLPALTFYFYLKKSFCYITSGQIFEESEGTSSLKRIQRQITFHAWWSWFMFKLLYEYLHQDGCLMLIQLLRLIITDFSHSLKLTPKFYPTEAFISVSLSTVDLRKRRNDGFQVLFPWLSCGEQNLDR